MKYFKFQILLLNLFIIDIETKIIFLILKYNMGLGDWGLGMGDWGLGIGAWAQSSTPNPQFPIPN